ncbi:MAG: low temperature requirement protein A [Chloroflexia bacterium]|nr:low temperature requirement protein A [Chloroflexia bacterium]
MNGNRLLKTGMGRGLLLRDRAENLARIEPIELFFDLVFVFAITQLSHLLLAHPSPRGAGETLLLLMAVWSAWSFTAWTTSWFDSSTIPVRLLLIAIMVISLFMGAAIPAAFGDDGLEFAIAFVAIQVGRNAWTILALGLGHSLSPSSLRVLIWSIALGALWIGGGLLEGDVRLALWILAVALDYVVTWFGFPIPGRANTRIPVWAISGGHLAERNELFIILALGESILLTGAAFGDLLRSVETVLALIGAFIGSVSLWWLYFDRGAAAGRDAIARSGNPGWLARSAYT